MEEIKLETPEIKLIPTERTSIIKAMDPEIKPITGWEYRRLLRKAAFAFGVSLGVNIAQAIIIYILQAGPV